MAAGVYNLTIEQGVDLALEVAVKDSTAATYSLTGATAAAQIRDTYNGSLLATFASVTATGTTGVLTLALNAATASARGCGCWQALRRPAPCPPRWWC